LSLRVVSFDKLGVFARRLYPGIEQ